MKAVAFAILLMFTGIAVGQSPPVKVVFDTDMDSDCDDIGALGMLHALADLGEAEILATVVSTRNDDSPQCVAAVNAFYGRPDLPVGRPATGPLVASKYARGIASQIPHRLKAVPDSATVYVDVLKNQPDGSVVIVTVGYLTNIAALLRLPAEGNQPSGRELVEKKVKLWVCMGGNFLGRPATDDLKLGNNNFTFDKTAAHFAIHNWPTKLMFVGREIGSVPSGLKVGAKLKSLPTTNPVRQGYALWFGGEPKDRHVADQTTVLYAVRGVGDRWMAEPPGFLDLRPDMTFVWRSDANGRHSYLLKRDGKKHDRATEREIETLMMSSPRSRSKSPVP